MGEHSLGFNERRFLELYRRFYGESYPAAKDKNQNAHVKGQKAVYLLMQKQVGVGDYGFTWQQFGPCSDALQELMCGLDLAPKSVEKFYQDFPGDIAANDTLYSDDGSGVRLFEREDAGKIDAIRDALNIPEEHAVQADDDDTPVRRWVELLGSLTYISTTRLPGASEERVWEELLKAKTKEKYLTATAEEKNNALRVLREGAFLSCAKA